MKKITYLVVLISILLFPSIVSAYELSCGNGPYSFDDTFECKVKGANNINYDLMSGSIEKSEYVSCLVSSPAEGMKSKTSDVTNKFDLTGRSVNDDIVTFKCQIIAKPTEDISNQVMINNFTYHDSTSQAKEMVEVLRSNTFTIKKYDETATKPVDTKPRDTSNSNSRLRGVTAEGLDFTFSSFITEYNIDVLYEVDQIELMILPYNLDATYRVVGSQKLSIGDNVIDIYVTSPDGLSTTCYTLYIKRLPRGEQVYHAEADATLKDLIISGQNINFEKEKEEYTININYDVNSVDINAVPTVEEAKVTISNFSELENGDVITITVESQDGTSVKKYLITVNKALAPYDYTKILTLGGIGLLGFILIILFIRSSKKSKEDPLLKIKKDKRKINKGQNFDPNAVPEATSTVPNQAVQTNVIKVDSANVASPIMVDPNAVDTNLNKISSNVNTLDLNSTALPNELASQNTGNALPQAPINADNSIVSSEQPAQDLNVGEVNPINTLDLNGTPVPGVADVNSVESASTINPVPVVNEVGQQASNMAPVNTQSQVLPLDGTPQVSIPVPPNDNQVP